ncbi:Glutamate-rich protein 5 [Camelus dromedarius]|uniref:Glutamate-rich protein 5 n=1 Tax=Camelus dromedarius TaxID=9838 RepID=A0A5N4CG63_CAMDR|nr:Glutamate-rich protein 5 [Camelus dromedarius]
MGCSSSSLNKASDSNRLHSEKVTSNMYFSTTEESESCFVQPKPRTLGRESTLYGKVQKESLPPLEEHTISAVSTANCVKPLGEQPLAEDAADTPGSTEGTQPPEGLKESGPPQLGGKDDIAEAEEEKDVEAATEAPPFKGSAEADPVGAEAKSQPLRTAGEGASPGAVEGTENPPTATEVGLLETAEEIPPLEAAGEPPSQEALGKDEQSQLPETVPKETESPEMLEGGLLVETAEKQQLQGTLGEDKESQLVETIPKEASLEVLDESQLEGAGEEQQLQGTLGKDKQPRRLETIPREDETAEVLDRSQLVGTAGESDSLHKTPEGPGNVEQIQPERIAGSLDHPSGALDTGANVERIRRSHTDDGDQHVEGETGEKVETEMENENVSEGAETKEEETGEAVGLSAAT